MIAAPGNGSKSLQIEIKIKLKSHDDRDLFILYMNYMIKKKFAAASSVM